MKKIDESFLAYFDTEEYFKITRWKKCRFWKIYFWNFDSLDEIFSKSELEELKSWTTIMPKRIKNYLPDN